MRWLERVMEMRAKGTRTEKDYDDAANGDRCLVAEAAVTLGLLQRSGKPEFTMTSKILSDETGVPNIGGMFPVLLYANLFDRAEELCHKVDDAVLRLKRDGIERCERNGWDEV